jgi:uncharacterized repeat protein (TIGR03803 family)
MRAFEKILQLLSALTGIACLVVTGQATAQTLSTLRTFTGAADGGRPIYGGLLLSSNRLYGTAAHGGDSDLGTVFAVNVDGTGFTLQSSTNLDSPVWTTNVAAPLVVNGQYTLTNPISGTQKYFRLSQ